MNKTKKIAIAAASLAMAGTLALGVFGCNTTSSSTSGNGGGSGISSSVDLSGFGSVDKIGTGEGESVVATNTDKSINYESYNRANPVTLNMACGHDSKITSMAFQTLSNGIVLPDGNEYQNGELKPAWKQVGSDLNITFNDLYLGKKTSENFSAIVGATGDSAYDNIDVFTSDLSKVVDQVGKGKSVLNLGNYLDLMPHFKKFLEENPVVYLSLLQAGMQSNGAGKTLYVAPYFDGYDDIERYYLIREDWAKKVLNGDTALDTEIPSSAATTTVVEAEFTANYEIKSMNAAGTEFQTIKKDYASAKNAVNESGALHDAYVAIAGDSATFEGANGNIVTIMNDAISKADAGKANANNLAKLYRAYIDVAYKSGSNAAYTASTRANLFNGYDAAWDVDDLVAIMRIMTRAPEALLGSKTGKVEGIVARENNNDRSPDVLRLITGLYGVRGADSRYEYGYIDNTNKYQDARLDAEFYEAILKGNKLYQEGLVRSNYYNTNGANYKGTVNAKGTAEGFIMYDYVQTQTGDKGFGVETKAEADKDDWEKSYYLGAIINPVAKWSVSSKDDTIMRFTESWRSTKTGGLALNGKLANSGNEAKLLAALQFIDYLYSDDGRIVSSFGPMASAADSTGGFWYNTQATQAEIDAGKYFTYKGVKYSGTDYKGEITPTITENMYKSFLGERTVEPAGKDPAGKYNLDNSGGTKTAAKSFTNYARMLIGSTLPMCVKSQSFEYQCTAKMGRDSAFIVGVAIDMGILNHVTPAIKVSGNTLKGVVAIKKNFSDTSKTYVDVSSWYIMVPSGLPTNSLQQQVLSDTTQNNFMYCTGSKPDAVNKASYWSFFHVMISSGFTQDYNITNAGSLALTGFDSVDALLVNLKNEQGGQARENTLQQAWQTAVGYCSILFK